MIESDYFEWYFLTSEWRAKTSYSYSFNILASIHAVKSKILSN